ncbi:hypothetical protein SASPL_138469 [Salvia splendens]|uniref:GIR1-like zinc ribbon domain-containing protein n=1 Tax=Salvia splendens TaxID=180675 RepID=A0A8X8WV80_SALSN|nr:hypothetical protein SASPL_138469 [Salvia splendens]
MNVNGAKLELKLNLSPPRSSQMTSSCASVNQQDEQLCYSTSPTAKMMMLVGCPRCLMYVMLSEEDPRCLKCKSSVLLDIMHSSAPKTNRS